MTREDYWYLPPDPDDEAPTACPVEEARPGRPWDPGECGADLDDTDTVCAYHQEVLPEDDLDWYQRHAA